MLSGRSLAAAKVVTISAVFLYALPKPLEIVAITASCKEIGPLPLVRVNRLHPGKFG
jgi:hypothetical protein